MAVVALNTRVLGQVHPLEDSFEGQLVDAVAFERGQTLRVAHRHDEAPIQPPAAQAVKKNKRVLAPGISLGAVVAAGVVVPMLIDRGVYGKAAAAVTGISVFAGIYAGAQAIERLLEPLSHWLLPAEDAEKAFGEAVEEADKKVTEWASNPRDDQKKHTAEEAMNTMAKKKNGVDERRDDRAAIFWAIASIVGMFASAQFGLFLLKLIGVSSTYGWDVFATGLILGGGTKPIHDVITKVSKSSSSGGSSGDGSTTTTTI